MTRPLECTTPKESQRKHRVLRGRFVPETHDHRKTVIMVHRHRLKRGCSVAMHAMQTANHYRLKLHQNTQPYVNDALRALSLLREAYVEVAIFVISLWHIYRLRLNRLWEYINHHTGSSLLRTTDHLHKQNRSI